MTAGSEWFHEAFFALQVVGGLAFSALNVLLLFYFANRMMGQMGAFLETKGAGGSAEAGSFKILLRRIWCRHRVVARMRGKYGRQYTGCASCGKDVNAGRPREEWR